MTALLNFGSDIKGYNTFASPISTDKFSATIAAAGNTTLTVPSNYNNWIVSFSFQPGSDIWVAYNGSAAAPVGGTFAATTSELLPGARLLLKGTTINCFNNGAGAADVGVIMYAIS